MIRRTQNEFKEFRRARKRLAAVRIGYKRLREQRRKEIKDKRSRRKKWKEKILKINAINRKRKLPP